MNNVLKKPEWLKIRVSDIEQIEETANLIKLSITTVCDSAECPNLGNVLARKLQPYDNGNICTRRCRFCAVTKGDATPLDPLEPERIGQACKEMGLKHVVVTSVTRDDLDDVVQDILLGNGIRKKPQSS